MNVKVQNTDSFPLLKLLIDVVKVQLQNPELQVATLWPKLRISQHYQIDQQEAAL